MAKTVWVKAFRFLDGRHEGVEVVWRKKPTKKQAVEALFGIYFQETTSEERSIAKAALRGECVEIGEAEFMIHEVRSGQNFSTRWPEAVSDRLRQQEQSGTRISKEQVDQMRVYCDDKGVGEVALFLKRLWRQYEDRIN